MDLNHEAELFTQRVRDYRSEEEKIRAAVRFGFRLALEVALNEYENPLDYGHPHLGSVIRDLKEKLNK